jgi:hypothetical protein
MRFASILLLALVGLGFTTTVAPTSALAVVACGDANDLGVRKLCISWAASPSAGVDHYLVRTTVVNKPVWGSLTPDSVGGAFQSFATSALSHDITLPAPDAGDSLIVNVAVRASKGGVLSAPLSGSVVLKRLLPVPPAPPSGLVIDSIP